jgi:hypothetical protein
LYADDKAFAGGHGNNRNVQPLGSRTVYQSIIIKTHMEEKLIDQLVAKETLLIGFLCLILIIGTFLRKLNKRYGVVF